MDLILLIDIMKEFIEPNHQKKVVLRNINIAFPSKGFYVIEGQSGAGKSTLIKIMAQIMTATKGVYLYQNKDLGADEVSRAVFRNDKVGLLFQDYQLITSLSPIENVMLPLLMHGENHSKAYFKALMLFERFNLKSKIHAKIETLSGGEKQRIAFLRAMINDPDFYLCDEPTGALDENNAHLLLDTLKRLSNEKLVIVVTHNPIVSHRYADGTYVLKDGVLYEK